MARLTKEQWAEIKATWESDPREGFDWLANDLGGVVSRQAISKSAKAQGWVKSNSTEKVAEKVAQPKSCATKSKKVAQLKAKSQLKSIANTAPSKSVKSVAQILTEKREAGRPTLYKPEYDEVAYKFCLLGLTDEEISGFFGVDERTINNWKIEHPGFFQSMLKGKEIADAEVAQSLYQRAKGYQYTEIRTKEVLTREEGDEGELADGEMKVVEVISTVKEVSPDTGAAFIWLKNRRSKEWKDKQEVLMSHKVDKEMMDRLATDMIERMANARERQRQVLIERGITIDADR